MSREHDQYDLNANIQEVLNVIHTSGDAGKDTEPDEETLETIHVYPVEGGGILLTRTPIEEDEDLDTTPLPTRSTNQPTANAAIGVWFFGLFVILSCLMFQFYVLFNPLTVTVTLAAESQQIALHGPLQLGRVLNPITLSQSQTIPTTGRGHQDARSATGYVTFYNGQFNQVTIPAGTILTGNDGIQIATDQDSTLPGVDTSANPPILGQATVAAQATSTGSRSNIAAYDINQACCATSVFAKNTAPFHGGQDERSFQTVAKSDITNTAAPLQAMLNQSVQGALQGQLKTNEDLVTPSCTTTTTPDHQAGQEATKVKVTVSETCSGVAVNQDALQAKVTDLLNAQAAKKLGSGYSILGNPQITINQAASQSSRVVLFFKAQSTWVYALSVTEQKHIKNMIAGKTKDNAFQLLLSLPGIAHVSIQSSGFGDDTRIPKYAANIHLAIIYV